MAVEQASNHYMSFQLAKKPWAKLELKSIQFYFSTTNTVLLVPVEFHLLLVLVHYSSS